MAFYISPSTTTTQAFPTATTGVDRNLSTTTTGINSAGAKDDESGNKLVLFIIVATIPTVILLILIAVVLARRVRNKESREPFFKVQVEYNDKPRRPRSSNSRLDLTINGMQIDVEYEPSPSDKRISRLSSTSFAADPDQVRELHKLSQECKENLVRIHEMLEREFEPAMYDDLDTETPSLSQDSEPECNNTRESICSTYSADEKGSNEPSEKDLRRSTSSANNQDKEDGPRDLSNECCLGNDFGDFIDSVFNSNEEEIEVENVSETRAQKPTIPPKPSSLKIQKDKSANNEKPKPIPRNKNKKENQETSPKNDKKEQHLSIKKPPIPKKRISRLRLSSKNDEKPTIVRRRPEVPKKSVGKDNCSCDKKTKPPIPKKPEGLVIKITKRVPKKDEVSSKRQSAVKVKRTSKNVPCEDV